ncbi:MAG: RHS repeat protein [Anaerolineales bacterium]|nr:RHS repeat protein [Anaerolineales bacterium]
MSILETNPDELQIIQKRGNALLETSFVFQPGGENVTTETVAGRKITHHFAGGVYVGAEDPLGNFPRQAILDDYRAWGKVDANSNPTYLDWSAGGKYLDAVTDALGQETLFTYDEEDRLQSSTDAEGRQTSYFYDANHRKPTMIVAGAPVTEVDINGGMEEAGGWSAVGTPQLNFQSSTQVDSEDSSRHVVADAVGEGIQSLAWDLEAGQSYFVRARVYAVKGQVKMQAPGVAAFDAETTQTGVWETLTAEHTPVSADTGKRLQFVAATLDNGECEFYVDTVSITTTGEVDVNGGMELDTGWSGVGTPTTNERSTTQVDSGLYSRHVVTGAADEGVQSIPWNLVAGQAYTLRARVYPAEGVGSETVQMRLVDGSAQEIAGTSDISRGTNAWETLSCLYTPGTDVNNARLQFLADGGATEFYVDTVLITLVDTLPLHGDMEEDNYWFDIPGGEPQTNERCIRVDSGTYFRHVAVDAVNEGIESVAWDLIQDHTYLVMARICAAKGRVKMQVPGVAALDAETLQTGTWETLRAIYEHVGSTTSQTLQFVAAQLDGGTAEFFVDTVHLLDLGVVGGARKDWLRWQEFAYEPKGRLLAERTVNPEDATLVGEVTRSYYAFGPGSGLLYQMIQNDLEGTNDRSTIYTYDSAGRVVKTQQLCTFGGCQASYTVYDAAGNVLASICSYDPGTHAPPTTAEEAAALYDADNPDKNQVTAYRYDEMGRQVEVTTNVGASHALTTLTLYNALSRVTRTITGYQRPQGINPPGAWQWNGQTGQWEDGSQHPISHGEDNTENIIADTVYNQRGQVRLRRDVLGNVTLYGYDDAGRQVKVVRNASVPNYNNDYTGSDPNPADPDLSDYDPVDAPDRDIITTAEYDAAANQIRTVDPLGNTTLMVYDALNRLVKTVRSASDPDYDIRHDPALAKYLFNDTPDLDLVEETVYETMGRVLYTVDPAGMRTWYAYDDLDRQVKTIVNAQGTATDGGTGDPRSDFYTASDDPDKDLISCTCYDGQGRVQWTLDPIGRRTWHVYDGLGRPVKTVANCTYDPENPLGVPPEDPSYTGSPDSDKDVISHTIYDTNGRVAQTIDARGNVTRYASDALGRRP